VDVGVGFAYRAAAVVAVGFLRIYGFYISASVYPWDHVDLWPPPP